MLKKLIVNFLMVTCLLLSSFEAQAVLKSFPEPSTNVESIFELNPKTLMELDKTTLEEKLGRRLTFKEKLGFKFIKRKLKKNPELSESEAWQNATTDGFAIAGFVTGVVGLFAFGIILGILAIVFSGISLKRIRRDPDLKKGRGLAIAGLILGIVATVLWLFLILLAISFTL